MYRAVPLTTSWRAKSCASERGGRADRKQAGHSGRANNVDPVLARLFPQQQRQRGGREFLPSSYREPAGFPMEPYGSMQQSMQALDLVSSPSAADKAAVGLPFGGDPVLAQMLFLQQRFGLPVMPPPPTGFQGATLSPTAAAAQFADLDHRGVGAHPPPSQFAEQWWARAAAAAAGCYYEMSEPGRSGRFSRSRINSLDDEAWPDSADPSSRSNVNLLTELSSTSRDFSQLGARRGRGGPFRGNNNRGRGTRGRVWTQQTSNDVRLARRSAALPVGDQHSPGPAGDSRAGAYQPSKVESVHTTEASGGGSLVIRQERGGHLDVRIVYQREFLLQCAYSPYALLPPPWLPRIAADTLELLPMIPSKFEPRQYRERAEAIRCRRA